MKNKHAKLIHAWIDGAEIERKGPIDKYPDADWEYDKYPCWFNDFEYRIKPEPQYQEPQWLYVYNHINNVQPFMSLTLMRDTSAWVYLGKVEVIK